MGEPLSFIGRCLPPTFAVRTVSVAPAEFRLYRDCEWRDALVVVERGEIELESLFGARRSFRRGDVLWLAGLRLHALRNRGSEPAVLLAVSRRPQPRRIVWPVVRSEDPVCFPVRPALRR